MTSFFIIEQSYASEVLRSRFRELMFGRMFGVSGQKGCDVADHLENNTKPRTIRCTSNFWSASGLAGAVSHLLKGLTKRGPGSEQSAFDGADRRSNDLCDIAVVESLEISKNQNRSSL